MSDRLHGNPSQHMSSRSLVSVIVLACAWAAGSVWGVDDDSAALHQQIEDLRHQLAEQQQLAIPFERIAAMPTLHLWLDARTFNDANHLSPEAVRLLALTSAQVSAVESARSKRRAGIEDIERHLELTPTIADGRCTLVVPDHSNACKPVQQAWMEAVTAAIGASRTEVLSRLDARGMGDENSGSGTLTVTISKVPQGLTYRLSTAYTNGGRRSTESQDASMPELAPYLARLPAEFGGSSPGQVPAGTAKTPAKEAKPGF